ncbi:hypothetical protein Trydic_g12689 [Trypoxylus dichotomus]
MPKKMTRFLDEFDSVCRNKGDGNCYLDTIEMSKIHFEPDASKKSAQRSPRFASPGGPRLSVAAISQASPDQIDDISPVRDEKIVTHI